MASKTATNVSTAFKESLPNSHGHNKSIPALRPISPRVVCSRLRECGIASRVRCKQHLLRNGEWWSHVHFPIRANSISSIYVFTGAVMNVMLLAVKLRETLF